MRCFVIAAVTIKIGAVYASQRVLPLRHLPKKHYYLLYIIAAVRVVCKY